MIILSNCFSKITDEGGLKVANHLARRMKEADRSVLLVSCGKDATGCDCHYPANKLLLNAKLACFLRKSKDDVLYIPAFARMLPTAVRIALLSLYTRRRLRTLLVMKSHVGTMARMLLKLSRAEIIALSDEALTSYQEVIGKRATRLYAGVDTKRFVPVDAQHKAMLREKYGIPINKLVVLHVGHLTEGRNLSQLLKLNDHFHIIIVVSSFSLNVKDEWLRAQLLQRSNVTLIDEYLPAVEEIYQLSDVYFFPVVEDGNCIDVPLSAMEAAACGVPVVSTEYGEMCSLIGKRGIYRIDSFDADALNALVRRAVEDGISPRENVLCYNWDHAVEQLIHK